MWGRKKRMNTCVACVAAVAVSACLCLACGREQAMTKKVENIPAKEAASSSGAVAASLPGVSAGADEGNSLEAVRKAYGEILDRKKYANEKEDMEGYYFAVSDLDFNGIPELVLREGLNLLCPAEYYTFEQGEVVELSGPDEGPPVPGGLYLSRERGSYAFMRGGTMEKSWHVIMEYKIKGHEIVLTDSWDAQWDDDWFGKKNPVYKRNEKECGEDEFMATYRAYEDNYIDFVPNTKKSRKSVLERGE